MGFLAKQNLIMALGKQTGWYATRRDHDTFQLQAKNSPNVGYLYVRHVDERKFVSFWGALPVRIPLAQATTDFYAGLLARNRNRMLANWSIDIVGTGEIQAYFHYSVPKAGLDAGAFNFICLEIVEEIDQLYTLLRSQLADMGNALRPTDGARQPAASLTIPRAVANGHDPRIGLRPPR